MGLDFHKVEGGAWAVLNFWLNSRLAVLIEVLLINKCVGKNLNTAIEVRGQIYLFVDCKVGMV